jgi:DNA-binding NarL/FixJ family response regulator
MGNAMKPPRVILADDHRIVAEALSQLVAPYFNVVATVADGHALIEAALSLKPDVAVVDVAMPLLNGLEAGRQLKTKMPGLKLIFLTMNEDPELAAEAISIGASGYVLKTCAGSELLQAIRAVLRGKSHITRQIARAMRGSFIHNSRGKGHCKSLTLRQREVVQLLAEGKSMKEAANVLSVTERTVAFHKYRAMRRLRVETNADLIQFAVRDHIVVQ